VRDYRFIPPTNRRFADPIRAGSREHYASQPSDRAPTWSRRSSDRPSSSTFPLGGRAAFNLRVSKELYCFPLPPGGSRGTSGEGESRAKLGFSNPSPAATASDPPEGRVKLCCTASPQQWPAHTITTSTRVKLGNHYLGSTEPPAVLNHPVGQSCRTTQMRRANVRVEQKAHGSSTRRVDRFRSC